MGVCEALSPGDPVSGTYRGHATYLARGGPLPGLFAELYGKDTGRGPGQGRLHAPGRQWPPTSGTSPPWSARPSPSPSASPWRRKALGTGRITATFFGDGATEEGVFYESLNFAALKKLPVLFVCENNGLAIHEPIGKRQAADRLVERVSSFGHAGRASGQRRRVRHLCRREPASRRDQGGLGPAFLDA